MGRLLLNNFGPINSCDISIDRFTVFTGPQAAGKSTIAKAIAYFRTLKDDLRDCIIKQQTTTVSAKLIKVFSTQMRHKFLQLFGSSRAMDNDMNMQYYYDDNTFIHVSLKMAEGSDYIAPKYIYIDFSKDIDDYLTKPADEDEIVARVKLLLKRSQQKMDSNPLTHLPGNPSIQARVERCLWLRCVILEITT